jgi:hypothetical protein
VAGTLRYFADRFGVPRAAIEGTQIPRDLVRKYAVEHPSEIVFVPDRSHAPLARRRRVTYAGFDLEREDEPLREWRGTDGPRARHALAAALARGDALHPAVRRHQPTIDAISEVWRRSAAQTPKLGVDELTALYEQSLEGVDDAHQWRAARLDVNFDALISREERERWLKLPGAAEVRGRTVPLEYDVEFDEAGAPRGVVRLRLAEKLARALTEDDVPVLDRPVRFVAFRGARGSVKAATLPELRRAMAEGPAPREDDKARRRDDERSNKRGKRHGNGRPPWRGKPRRGRR